MHRLLPSLSLLSLAASSLRTAAIAMVALVSSAGVYANPLNLTPGTAADKTLGSISTLANFNTAIATADISYNNSDLATRSYAVRLPSGYNPADSTKKYGIVTWIDAGDAHTFPASYAAALDAHDVIWLGGIGIGNAQAVNIRRGVALMGAFRMTELYNIDPARIYVGGLSGGGRTASDLAYLRSDYLRGFIGRVGSSIPGTIPGWESAGTNSTNPDSDYETMVVNAATPSVVLPPYFRTAIMTQYSDFRRAENLAIYRWGHLNHGNTVRAVVRPGGHSDEIGPSFTDALGFLYHPLADIIWDRFEDAKIGANTQAGKIVAGTGFTPLSGSVSETNYSYNSVSHGVLRLTGTGAAARAYDPFSWQNAYGILLDARLRAENAITANQNQSIGLHIIPAAATGPAAEQPGFHLYWNYGQPYRAEIVSATGVRKTLATWEHAATHPMSLAATNEKTFYGDTAAPDIAGKTKSFRGEDVRLVLNSTGFQLTFNRYANNLQTTYPGVVLVSQDSSTPYAENIPMVLQALWSDVETALVSALPSGDYQLVLTNDAIITGQAVGNAVVDEIRLVGSTGLQAAPPLTVTAPANLTRSLSWTRTPGAMGYVLQRASSPDGPFSALTTLANTASTYTDTVAQNIAYYYRIAATGKDGATGTWSSVGFAARNIAVPATPSSPSVTYPANYQARLAWTDAATTETAYRVERSPAGRDQWSLIAGSLAANSTSYTDTTVAAGTSYDYRISATGTGGISAYATVSATVPDVAPPVPSSLAASSTTYTSTALSWSVVSQAGSYRVKSASSSGGPYTTLATGLTSAAYTDTTLSPGVTRYYVVSAVGNVLESANSAEIAVTPPALLPPATFTVTPGFTTNTLNWSAVADVSGYTVQRATSATGPYSTLADALTATTYTDTGLTTGVTYYYRVVALSGTATSSATAAFGATPVAGTFTKANNTTSLDSATSWSPAAVPSIADTVLWTGTYTSGAVGIGSGLTVHQLQLTSPSQAITLTTGSGPLTLGAGGIDLSTTTQNLTLNAPVVLATSQPWTVASGRTLTFASALTAALNPAPTLTVGGAGTLTYDGSDTVAPFPGTLALNLGTLRANQAAAVLTLNATNLPAATTHSLTSLTGASGATWIIDAAPTATLTFASNTAGLNLILKNGSVTYNALSGNTDATNLRVEGGTFTIAATSDRYEVAAANQTFQVTGGTVDVRSAPQYGFRVGGSGNASQSGAQNVSATQSGGTVLATTFNLGGSDTTTEKSPSYALSSGTLNVGTSLTIGADTAGLGTATFALSGGKLLVPTTLSGAQAGARQIFTMSGGTLAIATFTATNLRSADAAANGTFAQSGGTLAPGDLGTAGRTALTGNYSLGASATLALDLGGTTQATAYQTGQYDYLTVSGTTTFSGSLQISLINGFTPSNASTFTVLNSTGTLSGTFTFNQRLTTTGGEGSFLVTQVANTVVLSSYQPALTALESWRQTHFGTSANTGTAADTADPDGDGAPNLLEYALGTTPTSASSVTQPNVRITNIAPQRLEISFLRARADVTYLVEASSDLSANSWSVIATNHGTVGQSVTVTDTVNISTATPPRRFLRLRVTTP